jgi:hypothetical protein
MQKMQAATRAKKPGWPARNVRDDYRTALSVKNLSIFGLYGACNLICAG